MESKEKTREEVMAEREARKKAKLAKKKPKQSGIVTNDVDKNVHNSIDSTSKKPQTVTDCASPSSLLLNSILKTAMDGTSKKRQSVTDCAASPRPAVKSVFNVTDSTSKKSQSATSCAKPPAPLGISNSRQTVTDCAPAPRVNDQLDGCLPKRSFFEPMVKEMKMLSNDLMAKAVISDEKSVLKHPASSPTIQEVSLVLAPHDVNKVEPVKSKAELKAERRAKQEAQRAAKAGIKTAPTKTAPAKSSPKPTEVKPAKSAIKKTSTKTESEGKSKSVTFAGSSTKQASQSRIKLFSHLYRDRNINFKSILNSSDLHPEVVGLGIQYSNRIIVGSNARCVAFLHVLKKMLSDYKTPAEKEFSRGFESKLEPTVNFLNQCRPISVSMTNALKHIKWHLTQLPNNITDAEARLKMSNVITMYIKEQIEVAGEAISLFVRKKIANGDVILTFGCSSLVERILKDAQAAGVDFSVVIIDSAPWFEGKELLRRLTKAKIPCTYVLISAASYIMKQASKVLLGAHALLANGCVMSRSGTALVALLANTANVPVLVCCETHKFSERVQTDAFVYNELGDPNELVTNTSPLFGWESNTYLVPLSLVYDVTPPDLVTAVVTELAILPCTSVPVVLRVKPTESA